MSLEVIYLSPQALTPYEGNTRKHSPEDIEQIKESILADGFNDPIGIWGEKNLIVEGHGRQIAAMELGLESVPCIRLDHLTDTQRRDYAIRHNRTAELSGWDFGKLEEEIARLEIEGVDLSGLKFDLDALNGGGNPEINIVEDEPPEPPETPIAKLGDIWQLGRHRLMCGDSTDEKTVDELMCGNGADLIYTDPPYGMNAVSSSGVLSEHYSGDIIGDDDNTVAINAFRLSESRFSSAKKVWFGANYYTECLPSAECWIVWDKNNGNSDQTDAELAWTNFRSVVRKFCMASEKTNRVHPTQKPCKLFYEILKKFDSDNNIKTVVDLFGGSGSTLIACEQLNRTCYMMELDPHYCDVIVKRWENLTGEKAVLLNA